MRGNKQCSNALSKVRNGFLKSRRIQMNPFLLSLCTQFLQFFSLKYRVWQTWFFVSFKLEFCRLQQAEKSSSNLKKNPVHQTGYFKNITYLCEAAMHSLVKHVSPSPLRLWKSSFPLTSCRNNMKNIVFRSIWKIFFFKNQIEIIHKSIYRLIRIFLSKMRTCTVVIR